MSAAGLTPRSGLTRAEVSDIEQAAAWYARLCSGSATEADHQGWQHWRDARPGHAAAWERVEQMQRRIAAVPGGLAAPALTAATRAESEVRRAVLRGMALFAGTASLAWWSWRQPLRHELLADLRTGIGEQRALQLADGSQLALNTRTAVDLAFDSAQRLLMLRSGEILVQTAPDPLTLAGRTARPFLVETAHGRMRALGTRFMVRTDAESTLLTVLEKAVEVRAGATTVLQAGQEVTLTAQGMAAGVQPADPAAAYWQQGSLVADGMPLGRLLEELGRYRPGLLGCDPSIAHLRVSGAFPVPDTDRALQVLVEGLPVRLESRSRYWVRVVPR